MSTKNRKLLKDTLDFKRIIEDYNYDKNLYEEINEVYLEYFHKMRGQDRRMLVTLLRYDLHDFKWRFEEYMDMDKSQRRGATEYKLKLRYGDIEGEKRWRAYCEKQANSNTFEYKSKKHGWTKEQFDEYNKSRSVTEENLINRHGVDKGKQMFHDYVEKQRHSGCSEEYFIDKYGETEGREFYLNLNKKKRLIEKNFITKYGKTEGIKIFNKYILNKTKSGKHYSNLSQDVFELIEEECVSPDNIDYIFYNNKNYEYLFNKKDNPVIFVDFYDVKSKKVIEFHGDYWHCNPEKYKPDFFNTKTKMTAQETWDRDKKREKYLRENFDVDYFVIWEYDWNNFRYDVLEDVKDYLCK